jgi:protein SCO1
VKRTLLIGFMLFALGGASHATAQQDQVLAKVGFTQNLDAQVPLNLNFRDETGKEVRLSQYFGHKPVILNLVYFECPMLCTEVLNGLLRAVRTIPQDIGKDFNVVTVSFDPKETPKLAAAKKRVYVDRYGRKNAEHGWSFLTGSDASIKALTDAVGFHFVWDPQISQFAHASGIMILTPEGKVARYFYGVEYSPKEMRLSLQEAGRNKIGSPVDKILLYCYHYDPTTGRYGLAISRLLKISGLLTLGSLVLFIFLSLRSERRMA